MRIITLCLLLILELFQCLQCLAIQALEAAEPPDDTRNFSPLFLPSTPSNPPGIPIEQAGTSSLVEPTSDAPDNFSISSWASPEFFTDLSAFHITHFASGRDNLEVVAGITEDIVHAEDSSSWTLWTNASAMLQLFYPKDSVNPARWPQGGSEFYAAPIDISKASNVTLEYKVFFPSDFEWVKGGKLPGLYGGHTGCSGGNAALDCFSTRLMWRSGGAGELYLYAPKDRQTPSLCSTPPLSVCDMAYGLSIGRGSFTFSRGAWTHVSQTVVLNSPGVQNGGFLLKVDGDVVVNSADVFYRDDSQGLDFDPTPYCDAPDSQYDDDDRGLLGHLLGGLTAGLGLQAAGTRGLSSRARLDSQVQQDEDIVCQETRADDPVGFQGVFFSTFFGGHHDEFATPKDQFVWFKDFALSINDSK